MTLRDDARAAVVEQASRLQQTFADEVLDALFMNTSEEEVLAAADARIRWEWWDGQEPINGVPADQVRERFPIPGRAYLVYVDDRLVYFQPHAPQTSGVAALDAVSDEIVTTFVASLVYGLARDALVAEVTAALGQLVVQQQEREAEAEAEAVQAEAEATQKSGTPTAVDVPVAGRRRVSAKGF